MIKDVESTKNQNGLTAIGKAVNLTLVELLPMMRPDADKLVILFTDGTNNKYPAPYIYADKLKDAGVKILTIGIGSDINNKELGTLASPGLSVTFDSFSRLVNSQNQILSHICPIPDPPLEVPCKRTKLDLVVVLDSSASISNEDYDSAKRFIAKIFGKLELGPNKGRVAMISFSNDPRLDFSFEDYYDNKKLDLKLRNLERFGGLTGIGKALQEVQSKLMPKQRSKVPFNILLITDGVNNIYPRPYGVANALKQNKANIITLGIGSDINLNELKALSSNDKVLTVDSFDELEASLKTIFETVICGNAQ
uniref:Collagen alpha-4 like protein n=1 Tax=Dugesia japonica TaxID=6161 RepID=A0AAN0N8N9_DUGJA